MSKPKNNDGLYCPFWQRPTAKVCDTCTFYTKMRRTTRDGVAEEWKCAINGALEAQTLALHKLDAITRSNDGARNAFVDFKQSMLRLISMLYQLRPHAREPLQIEDKSDGKG